MKTEESVDEAGTAAAHPDSQAQADSPKRQQILEGARKVFLHKGFEGSSMQDVAREAGVSKGTLYVYFDSKEAVFAAIVGRECGRMQDTVRRIGTASGDVREELAQIGRNILASLMADEVIASMRMMIGAAERFPTLAHRVYEAGPRGLKQALEEYLEMRARSGDLAVEDPVDSAALFVDMLVSGLQRRALLMKPPLSPEEVERHITRRLDGFLKLHRPS